MNNYFVGIRYAGDDYNHFISATGPINALEIIKRDWFQELDNASSIEIKEVHNFEVPE
jgi:hypothetical protein